MTNKIKPAPSEPWHEQIRKELETRDKKCKSFYGPINEYVRPKGAANPYRKFKTLADFKKAFPFDQKHRQQYCKLMAKVPSTFKDKHKRFYVDVKHPEQCKNVMGFWDSNALNRYNKYDRGVCWNTLNDKQCASKIEDKALRPFDVRRGAVEARLDNIKNKCETPASPQDKSQCKFVQTGKYSYDCYSSSKDVTPRNKTPTPHKPGQPPSDMPKDTRHNIEQWLYDWYVNKKNKVPPPQVADLFGTGNRCNPTSPSASKITSPINKTPPKRLSPRDLTLLDPSNKDHIKILLAYGVPPDNISEWQRRIHVEQEQNYKFNDDFLQKKIAAYGFDLADLDDEDPPTPINTSITENLMKPSIAQSVVNQVMKMIANNPDNTNRGILAWHSLGSGKTCTAAGVMDAFWDTQKQIIFASSLDAIAANPDYKFHECALNLFPRFQQPPFTGKNKEETLTNIANAFQQRDVRFLSFAKLANRVKKTQEHKKHRGGAAKKPTKTKKTTKTTKQSTKQPTKTKTNVKNVKKTTKTKVNSKSKPKNTRKKSSTTTKRPVKSRTSKTREGQYDRPKGLSKDDYVDLDNAVLIIDEVHNLFRPLATQRAQHEYLEKELLDPKKHPGLKIVILTATPGDNVPDVVKLLNSIRDPTQPVITPPNPDDEKDIQRFSQSIRGMISYLDMSQDDTKFPKVYDSQQLIKLPMSKRQFDKYIEAYKDVKDTAKDYEKLARLNQTNKYWKKARMYANMLYNFEKGVPLAEFSSKLPVLLYNIRNKPKEKHYVYSAFYENRGYGGQGILGIARQLDAMGYVKLTVQEAKKLNQTNSLPPSAKRYILAINNEIGDEGSTSAGKNLHQLIKIFNRSENKNGEYVHVFLASQGFNEGLDLKAVRHVHIFEPLVTFASDKQTIGRAARYCSHADLDRDNLEWTVHVHRYAAEFPTDVIKNKYVPSDDQITQIHNQINLVNNQLEQYKGRLSKENKIKKEQLNDQLKNLKQAIKTYNNNNKHNTHSIQNIEEHVFHNAKEKMRALITIYNVMRSVAIDCLMTIQFHSATGLQYTCHTISN